MESTTRALLKRQIQERTEQKRLEGDDDQFEAEHAAICETLDALIQEHRGPDCTTLLELVRDEYPHQFKDFETYFHFKL